MVRSRNERQFWPCEHLSCASGAQDKTEAGLQAKIVKPNHLEGLNLTDPGAVSTMTHIEALDMTHLGKSLSTVCIAHIAHRTVLESGIYATYAWVLRTSKQNR